ncbi:MAG: hypothetical protein IME96_03380 [Proteobacteria bacterium]|nr:hypothetical protein [Pseudomonadota bacterium]
MFAKNLKPSLTFLVILYISVISPTRSSAFSDVKNVDHILETLLKGDYYVSYQAEEVVIFFSNSEPKIERYKVGRLKPHKVRREKYNLDGTLEEVVVNDEDLQIISYPKRKMAIKTPLSKSKKATDSKKELIGLIKNNYDVKYVNNDEVSGRKALVISIEPKEIGTRPAFSVWFDSETGLIMKTETFDTHGRLSYLSSLRNIVINPSFPHDYFDIMVPSGTVAYELSGTVVKIYSPDKVKKHGDFIERLSGGYVLKEVMEDDNGQLQLLYHDGLNSVSVFSEQWSNERSRMPGNAESGAGQLLEKVKINGFEGFFCRRGPENIMSFVSDNHRLTVVGEVSKQGLVNISIDLKKRKVRR